MFRPTVRLAAERLIREAHLTKRRRRHTGSRLIRRPRRTMTTTTLPRAIFATPSIIPKLRTSIATASGSGTMVATPAITWLTLGSTGISGEDSDPGTSIE